VLSPHRAQNELDSALWTNDLPLHRRKVQTAGEIRPADLADEVRVATHDELITGSGQADVEAFAGAFERRHLVDDQHDGTALERGR
jgi:hypothetical protein